MNVLIVEDEELAVRKLRKLIDSTEPTLHICGVTGSIEESVNWLQQNPAPDLIFMDIELADGQSFEIFEQVTIRSWVIFTTSYDEYAIRAFRVNSIDYLLKPVQKDELRAALDKFVRQQAEEQPVPIDSSETVRRLVRELQHQWQQKDSRT